MELMRTGHANERGDGELSNECESAQESLKEMVEAMMEKFLEHAAVPRAESFLETAFVGQTIQGGIFVGHVNTDLDSVAGAIGAAHLFGGTPCIAEPADTLNGEIKFALELAGLRTPAYFADHPGAGVPDQAGRLLPVCLVDHNEPKQMTLKLRDDPDRANRICGLIDHHALSSGFESSAPLFIDVRPWGSMSTIVLHQFVRNNAPLPKGVATMLLCAILSDTLSLKSVTTTPADRFAVALLSRMAEQPDPAGLAAAQFAAKTEWICGLGPYEMVRGDQKDFECCGWRFGIAVLEVTTPAPVLAHAAHLIAECRCLKVEKGTTDDGRGKKVHDRRKELDFVFLFVVDVVQQESRCLIAGGRELALAQAAFPDGVLSEALPGLDAPGRTIRADQTLMHVGKRVSRKKEFAPACFGALKAGFECHKKPMSQLPEESAIDEPETPALPVGRSFAGKATVPGFETAGDVMPSDVYEAGMVHDSVRMVRDYSRVFDALEMPKAAANARQLGGSFPSPSFAGPLTPTTPGPINPVTVP